eukprot:1879826-Prorocentrum_lima.AAC.1
MTSTCKIQHIRTWMNWIRPRTCQPEYQACIDYGEMQVEYLKALDFMDILTEKLRFYHVCRAKTLSLIHI